MRKTVDLALLAMIWLSAAAAVAGFVLPWASMDVKYHDVARHVRGAVRDVPMGGLSDDAAHQMTNKLSRIMISVKRGAETVTGELPDLSTIPTQVNGPQIPQMVNRQDANVVVALIEMFAGQRQIGAKSYVVYALPALALVFALLLTAAGSRPVVAVVAGLASLALGGGTLWKLLTTNTDTLLVKITIERGLWLIAWSYVALGTLAFARLLTSGRRTT